MRKFIDGYYRLLNVLLGASVGILIVPVTIQMISRYTGLLPNWIWTEEMARFFFIWMVMLGAMIGVRDGVALRMRRVARVEAARQRAAARRLDGIRPGVRAGVRLVRHQVRAVRLEPDVGARGHADDVHLHRMAADRASRGCCSACERILEDIRIVRFGPGARRRAADSAIWPRAACV